MWEFMDTLYTFELKDNTSLSDWVQSAGRWDSPKEAMQAAQEMQTALLERLGTAFMVKITTVQELKLLADCQLGK